MHSQYREHLTLIDDIVNTLTDNIGIVIQIKYFVNTLTTMTTKLR